MWRLTRYTGFVFVVGASHNPYMQWVGEGSGVGVAAGAGVGVGGGDGAGGVAGLPPPHPRITAANAREEARRARGGNMKAPFGTLLTNGRVR
jgi:hypothetical protein